VAEAFYKAALDVQPGHIPSLHGRRRVAQRANNHAVLLDCALAESDVVANPERKTALLFDAACLCLDHLGDAGRALGFFHAVMDRSPTHQGAYDRLTRCYLGAEEWHRMVDVVVQRAQAMGNPEEQAALFLQGAQVSQHQAANLDRAMALYREVLVRLPHHVQALQAHGPLLFQHALWDEALEALQRLVTVTRDEATLNSAHRMLGIIFQENRRDAGRAVQAFEAAVVANPRDQESLLRCAAVHREEGASGFAVDALERLVRIQPDAGRRVNTRLELAELYEGPMKDPERSVQALREALADVPDQADAMKRLDMLLEKLHRHALLADILVDFITAVEEHDHMAAVPWQMRLAHIQEANLHNDPAALDELMHVVDVSPSHQPALVSMARIYARAPETRPHAVAMHRKLLRLDPFRVDSHHELFRLFLAQGETDKAFVMAEVLSFLKAANQDEDLLFNRHKASVPSQASGPLTALEYEKWVVHPDENVMARALLCTVASQLHDVYPGDLKKYQLERRDRHNAKSDLPLRKLADSLGTVIMPPEYELWLAPKLEGGLVVENRDPPALVVSEATARKAQDKELRFLLARQLERLKALHHVVEKLEPNVVEQLLFSLCRIARPEWPAPRETYEVEALQKKVLKAISRGTRKALEEFSERVAGVRTFDGGRHLTGCSHTSNRAGLAVTHDVDLVMRTVFRDAGGDVRAVFADAQQARAVLGSQPQVTELLHYLCTDEYFSARRKLGFAVS
jgi:tetratricopeptide (TPR) repeat protein